MNIDPAYVEWWHVAAVWAFSLTACAAMAWAAVRR